MIRKILALLALAPAVPSAAQTVESHSPRFVATQSSAYQSFIKNWSPDSTPLCAILASSADWDAVLHPAGVMGAHKPYAPQVDFWRTHGMLIVARTVPGAASSIRLEKIAATKRSTGVVVTYKLEGGADASFMTKVWLPIEVAKPLPVSAAFKDTNGVKCSAKLGGGAVIGTGKRP